MCWFWPARRRSVAGDRHPRFLYHQHLCAPQRHRAVQHPARNRECHTGSQLHWVAAVEFNAQAAVDDVEELVLLLVLVPVVFAAREDAQAEQDAPNLDQGLVVPGVVSSLGRFRYIDELKRAEQRLVVDPVVSLLRHMPHSMGVSGARPTVADRGDESRLGRSDHLISHVLLYLPIAAKHAAGPLGTGLVWPADA